VTFKGILLTYRKDFQAKDNTAVKLNYTRIDSGDGDWGTT